MTTKSAPYMIMQTKSMVNYTMNPRNDEDQQYDLILASHYQFKQQEHQEESVCWSLSSPLRPGGAFPSFSSSLNNENDNILDLINTLDKTDEILKQKQQGSWNHKNIPPPPTMPNKPQLETSFFSFRESLLEPTPFGPQGIQPQNVVNELPLTKSRKFLSENNQKDEEEALFSVLHPLLLTTEDDDGNFSENQQHYKKQHHHKASQNINEEDIIMVKLPDVDIATNTADNSTAFSPVDFFLVNANTTTGEDFLHDTATEVSDVVSHSFKRKLRPTECEEVPHSSEYFLPLITASFGAPSKKKRNMEYYTVNSSSEISTPTSNSSRNPGAAVITSDDELSCIDQEAHHHYQEQLNYQYDSSSLVLNGHTSDSSSCSSSVIAVSSATTATSTTSSDKSRFRSYQCDQWKERFQDLVDFKEKHGHCLVPYEFPSNQHLAEWTKRQRYQYKLKNLGRHSTLTDERQTALEQIGFIWDSHKAAWMGHFESLKEFKAKYGDCLVPSDYLDHSLAVWVKSQRRQHKLSLKGKKSVMTRERFLLLESIGFDWNPRNLK